MRFALLPVLFVCLTAPLALAQHDYSRTTYTTAAPFVYAQPEEGRILEMVPEGAVVSVDVRNNGWCPVRYEGTDGYVPRSALTSAPSLPAPEHHPRPTANPDVWTAPARSVPERPSPVPTPSLDWPDASALETIGAAFVGSKRSKVFHRASCSHVARVAAHNLVTYESAAEAEGQGKRPCQVCRPADA